MYRRRRRKAEHASFSSFLSTVTQTNTWQKAQGNSTHLESSTHHKMARNVGSGRVTRERGSLWTRDCTTRAPGRSPGSVMHLLRHTIAPHTDHGNASESCASSTDGSHISIDEGGFTCCASALGLGSSAFGQGHAALAHAAFLRQISLICAFL